MPKKPDHNDEIKPDDTIGGPIFDSIGVFSGPHQAAEEIMRMITETPPSEDLPEAMKYKLALTAIGALLDPPPNSDAAISLGILKSSLELQPNNIIPPQFIEDSRVTLLRAAQSKGPEILEQINQHLKTIVGILSNKSAIQTNALNDNEENQTGAFRINALLSLKWLTEEYGVDEEGNIKGFPRAISTALRMLMDYALHQKGAWSEICEAVCAGVEEIESIDAASISEEVIEIVKLAFDNALAYQHPLVQRLPQTPEETAEYLTSARRMIERTLKHAEANPKAFGEAHLEALKRYRQEILEHLDPENPKPLSEFPFHNHYLPNPFSVQIIFAERRQKRQGDEFMIARATYYPKDGNTKHPIQMNRLMGTAMAMLADTAEPDESLEKGYFSKELDPEVLEENRDMLRIGQYTADLNNFIRYIGYIDTYSLTKGFEWMGGTHRWTNKSAIPWNEFELPQTTFHFDPTLVLFHIISGAHRAVGHPERDPYNDEDRKTTQEEIYRSIFEREQGHGIVRVADKKTYRTHLDKVFKAAYRYLTKPNEQPNSPTRDTGSSEETSLTGIPTPPPPAKVAPREFLPLPDFDTLRKFANANFHAPNNKKNRRQFEKQRNRKRRETDEIIQACQVQASRLPEPVSGEVNVRKHRECSDIERVWLTRDPSKVATPSNLISEGTLDLRLKNNVYRLDWEMDGASVLTIKIGDQTFGPDQFNASETLANLYLEFRKLVASGLHDLLVRRQQEIQELHRRQERERRRTEEQAKPVPPVKPQEPTVPEIRPRLEEMFIMEGDPDDEPSEDPPHISLIPNDTQTVLDLLAQSDSVTPADIEGKVIRLFQEEIVDMETEKPSGNPAKTVNIYVPVGNIVQTLNDIRSGALGKEHIFLMVRPGYIRRAGYYPRKHETDDSLRYMTQKKPGPVSETIRTHLQKRCVGVLQREIPEERQRLIIEAAHDIRGIILKFREQITTMVGDEAMTHDRWKEVLLLTEDILLLEQGCKFEDGLSDGAGLVDMTKGVITEEVKDGIGETAQTIGHRVAAVLTVPQYALYAQGSFLSIKEAENRLTP